MRRLYGQEGVSVVVVIKFLCVLVDDTRSSKLTGYRIGSFIGTTVILGEMER
jgi:hypothetical protein